MEGIGRSREEEGCRGKLLCPAQLLTVGERLGKVGMTQAHRHSTLDWRAEEG